ncbi:unnamed protein product, partial [Mesorhabditis belari]|uniref:Ig-like domain-containing protein n=1 Tax=Mesorhabditis belari TaxID=2138241 RepID=A0AAF3ENL4_9BILA
MKIVVNSAPRIVRPPDGLIQYHLPSTSLSIECVADGNPPPEITWIKDEATISANSTLSITQLGEDDKGDYICQAQSSEGQTSSRISLRFAKPTTIDYAPSNKTVNEGANVFWNCHASAFPENVTYSWKYNGKPIRTTDVGLRATVQEAELSISPIRPTDTGWYACEADNRISKPATSKAYLQVNYRPTIHSNSKRLYTISLGSRVDLLCQADAQPPVESVLWTKNGVYLKTTNGTNLVFHRSTDGDAGNTRPQASAITSVQCLGEDGLVVDWNPGYDAGLPQTFTIHYENVDLNEEKGTLQTKETHAELFGLSRFSRYRLLIEARNSEGSINSSYLEKNVCSKLVAPLSMAVINNMVSWERSEGAQLYRLEYRGMKSDMDGFVEMGSGQSPIIETGPVEKKGDQFAAIITVGTSTQAQTETTKGMEITEGSGEMNDGSGEETTITMITEKDDALAREEASSSTQPEESAEGESPLSGYEQGNGERNGETTSKETIKETDKPERGGYASEKSGDHGKYSTTTVATEIAQASTPIDHKDKEPTDSEEIEVAELNKDAEKHMTEQGQRKIKEELAKSETTQSTAAAGDPYAAIVLPAESKESTPSTVTTTAFDTTNAPTIKAETIKATNAPTIDSTTQETTSEKPIAFTEELISTTTTKTLLKNDDDSHETSKLEPLLEPENSSDQLKTTTTTFEQNGSVLANEISGEQPKELSTEEPTATTVKPKDAYPTPPPTNQATTKKPVEPPGLEPKIHPSGYEEGKGPTGPLQPDTKPIDPSHAVGYPGIPPIEKAKSRPERFLKNPLFESRGTRKELMPTAKIIAEKSLKKTWRPFVFDCATEEDEKGPLCRDWADGGLCERHRPTRFLFCRKTCLCVGPPHLR